MILELIRSMRSGVAGCLAFVGGALLFGTCSSAYAGYSQNFDNVPALLSSGDPTVAWYSLNLSTSPGNNGGWWQGDPAAQGITSQSGPNANSYAWANWESTTAAPGAGVVISNWFLTPELSFVNGDTVSFYTQTTSPVLYPDRLELRVSTAGASTNVGSTPLGVGDFSNVLLDINPTYSTGGYPTTWTQYTATITTATPFTGRLGFRYFILDTNLNGSLIAIDTLSTTANVVPEPSSYALMVMGLSALAYRRYRKSSSV